AVKYEFSVERARIRRLRARISRTGSAHRYKSLGVDVFIGEGRFSGPDTIEVGGATLTFKKAAICTGARAAAPTIEGLREAGYLTNETIFALTELPPRLGVIGAGPIGTEMAQCFARFGSRVTVLERMGHVLPREDADAAGIVQRRMMKDGVQFILDSKIARVESRGIEKAIYYEM